MSRRANRSNVANAVSNAMPPSRSVAAGLADVQARIAAAAIAAGRAPGEVALAAVSKQQPDDRVDAALEAGCRLFAENRVQEARARWSERRAANPLLGLRLIGPLQTNKVADAVAVFDAIETLDRDRLARALAEEFARRGAARSVLVQVNTGAEPQKSGVLPDAADSFIAAARRDYGLPVDGLMCIPPQAVDPEPHFRMLAAIAARNGLTELSMGMSDDFEIAVRCGATIVRVGSAIFGAR